MKENTYSKFYLTVPYTIDIEQIVKMFVANDIKVDDLCTAHHFGRDIAIWINDDDLQPARLSEHVGEFWGDKDE